MIQPKFQVGDQVTDKWTPDLSATVVTVTPASDYVLYGIRWGDCDWIATTDETRLIPFNH
ncbi:hypothetical protein AWB88_02750 [Mycobacterium paraense]|nr:hypothetical protein AWB88_02750 [Mycobacterium paraense]